jgi:hypothetical protein
MFLSLLALAAGRSTSAIPEDWIGRWQTLITAESRDRYCDRETGEEIGWLIAPFLNGYRYGYLATRNRGWIDRLVDWTDSWLARGVKEPDGFVGWPKIGTGGTVEESLYTDSLLGEAMAFRPVVYMAAEILKNPDLRSKYGAKAKGYLAAAEQTFLKWNGRGCWREVANGGLWVVPAFGIDKSTGAWTSGYAARFTDGFSNPDNKENAIAEWMIAMYDVSKKPIYRERAEKWFRVMRSRIRTSGDSKTYVWDYWDPGGPWDYKSDGSTKHWVGVHPNGGYYAIDVSAIVDAYEHGLVFTRSDINRLIATNRDFMWDQHVDGAKFRLIDGGEPDPRWKDSPGVLWSALVPYDPTLRKVFEANFDPSGWGGLSTTPWYVWRTSVVR